VRVFPLLDEAIEWAENQIVFRFGGFSHLNDPMDLGEQPLLADLTGTQMEELIKLGSSRSDRPRRFDEIALDIASVTNLAQPLHCRAGRNMELAKLNSTGVVL
jgi:hypothetical protein